MSLIVLLVLGGLAGWIASMIMGRNSSMGLIANIVVGIVGAFLANLLLAPLFGVHADLSRFTLAGFIVSVVGACLLLLIVNLFTRRSVR